MNLSSLHIYFQRLVAQLPYIPWILKIIWHATPLQTSLITLLMIVNIVIPLVLIHLSREIINLIAIFSELDNSSLLYLGLMVFSVLGLTAFRSVLQFVLYYVRTSQAEHIHDYLMTLIHEKNITLDLSFYDSQSYYDMLYRSYVDAIDKPVRLINSLSDLLTSSVTLLGMMLILASYNIWLPVILIVGSLPILWVLLHQTLAYKNWRNANTVNERRSQYLHWLMVDKDAAMELRLFNLGKTFSQTYDTLRQDLRDGRLHIERKSLIAQLFALVSSGVIVFGITLWMGLQVLQGIFKVGDFAAFFQILGQGQALVQAVMSHATEIYQNILFIENLYLFVHLENQLKDNPDAISIMMPLKKGIRFEQVSFSYPQTTRSVFQDFNWEIPANRVTALIGENGEGKSTLLKLLCRFYDVDEGRILWDGIDIRDLPLHTLRQSVSVLFQEPVQYAETVGDNIAMSDLEKKANHNTIEQFSIAAGSHAFINKLPQKYDTMLGRWFGGEELSVGQWQRVALARAFLKDSPILILDEPTSAMDAWAEGDFLNRFHSVAKNKTCIMITHRFTTALYADRIDLLENGTIVESGNHQDLLNLGGRYATSWHSQTMPKQSTDRD